MKQGWEIKKLEDACNINYGTRVVQKRDGGTTFPVYGGGGATFKMDRYNREDCLIVARFAMSPQCVRFVQGKFFLNDSGLSIESSLSTLSQEFLNKHIIALNDKIYSLGKGAAQKNLDINALKNIELQFPTSIAEQEKIVEELDCLSGIIEKKKEQLKQLDALAQSIFYEMFGNPIENEKGWEVKRLKEICSYITDGSHYSPKDDKEGTIPMLSVKDMQQNSFSYNNCKMIGELEYQKLVSTGCKPLKGDVLIAKDGSYFKYIFVVKEEREQALLSSIAITRPDKTILNSEYLVGYLSTLEIYNLVESELLTGTALKRVILKGLRDLRILVPPLSLQQEFASKIEAIDKQKKLIKQSIKETETLFNSRMDYYFN